MHGCIGISSLLEEDSGSPEQKVYSAIEDTSSKHKELFMNMGRQ